MPLTALTPEQRASLSVWRSYWLRTLARTSPADRKNAERAVRMVHDAWHDPLPRLRWVDSPRGVDPTSWTNIGQSLLVRRLPTVAQAHGEVISGAVWVSVQLALARAAVGPRLWAPGPLDWLVPLSTYGFFRVALGVPYPEHISRTLDSWLVAVRAFGGLWRQEETCVLCERPIDIHLDADGRPHHESGAAVRFRDGFDMYFWHGTRMPPEWIATPHLLTPDLVLTTGNAAQRIAGVELIGWPRVLEVVKAFTIDQDADRQIGELLEVNLPVDGPTRLLRVLCGTGRVFWLRVPRHIQTARAANAWTYGLGPEEYRPEIRT